ncbi:acyl-CoA dehydrogenase domain protein [Parafrankia sp. EAN1pec]|uniref:acyl-CoA dehydrogenase family protein n=1 Tax=Parafrankia sp. (strain EAN1pec) TaxID=298653 RepID=UPI0000544969|nr:acyl-CoA dehydrogenase domain protein [Frankia sp. EAN1pec]
MLLELSSEQGVFRATTAKYLAERVSAAALRALRDDPDGFDLDYWRAGADLGWTSLLIGEDQGGGSISGAPLVDLGLIAYEFGRGAAPGPLVPTNIVAERLSVTGGAHAAVVKELAAGTSIASWCLAEPASNGHPGTVNTTVRTDGPDIVVDGVKRPVEAAGSATHFLVVGRTGTGLTQVLVPADTAGVSVTPMRAVDLTRRFCLVTFDGVRLSADAVVGDLGDASDDVRRQLQLALTMTSAESVGAMQRAFDVTLTWAFDRFSFGRPLATYQEIKHRFADMATWLEASHAITDAAVAAVEAGAPEADELVSAAKSYVGEYGSELLQDCVQIHGGIGLTFEHNLHLYLRRHTANRTLFGTPSVHRQRVADIVAHQDRPA